MTVGLSVEVIREGENRMINYMELREAFEQLPDEQRVILGLVLEGYSYQSIADILGMSRTTVGKRNRDALTQMREIMQVVSDEVSPSTSRHSKIRTCGIDGCEFTGNGWQVGGHKSYHHNGRKR